MPELPEVETTKRGLEPLIVNQTIAEVGIHRKKLRWEIPPHLPATLKNKKVISIDRRGKYLLVKFDVGTLIMHLGMSGAIRITDAKEELIKHDHFEIKFTNGSAMRFNDYRCFGAVLFTEDGNHKLLDSLGVEPLEKEFTEDYLYEKTRSRKQNVKTFIMNGKIVVGVGNIYASESLYMSGINPEREARDISSGEYKTLTKNIISVLKKSIKAGGTTIQDFKHVDGGKGYFYQTLNVYGREGMECFGCSGTIKRIIQNQRSTFYCPTCQPEI
jgi:formamidopyrimidine-DNA glycosylase